MGQGVAGEGFTARAVFGLVLRDSLAGFDSADDAAFRLEAVVGPAAGTGVAVPEVGPAQPAVHAARGDQGRGHAGLFRFGLRHIGVTSYLRC